MPRKSREKTNRPMRHAHPKALHDRIVSRICRLADAMVHMSSHHIQKLWNLRHTDLRLLNVLEAESPLSVNEISRRALLDQAWVSRSLRTLERAKLVERRKDPSDSRLTLMALTPRARDILDESRPYADWTEKVLLNGIDEIELKGLLDRLESNTQGLLNALESLPKQLRREKK
jgi:DNA-binding MarR family transcriptional regulator